LVLITLPSLYICALCLLQLEAQNGNKIYIYLILVWCINVRLSFQRNCQRPPRTRSRNSMSRYLTPQYALQLSQFKSWPKVTIPYFTHLYKIKVSNSNIRTPSLSYSLVPVITGTRPMLSMPIVITRDPLLC
jgi:hypothetical protein